jgi:hypothetical protein
VLRRQPAAYPGQEPPPLGRQYRQVQRVRVQPAQIGQLLQLALHRRRGRRDRPGPEPGQPRAAEHGIDRQQLVQLRLPLRGEQRGDPRPGLLPRPFPRGRDALQDLHDARPDQHGRGQVLACLPEQQLRRVVLHRPREQELLQVLPARPVHRPPAEVPGDLAQVSGAGLAAGAVAAQRAGRDAQLLRQTGHHGGRGGGHVVRDEPEPRQRAELHRHAHHVVLAPELPDERLISRPEREVPDQLNTRRLREAPQLRQLVV